MSWIHLSERKQRARKQHKCVLCCEQIEKGEIYVRRSGVYDNEFLTSKMHIECELASRDWDIMDWETFSSGDGTFQRPRMEQSTNDQA